VRNRKSMPTVRMAVALAAAAAISTVMPRAQGRGGGPGGGEPVVCTPEIPAGLSLVASFHEGQPGATSEGARFGMSLAASRSTGGNVIIAVRARHDGAGEPNVTFWSFDPSSSSVTQVGAAVEPGFQARRLVAANLDGDQSWPEFIASDKGAAPVIYAHNGVDYEAVATIPAPLEAASGFGEGLAVGDLDGDGIHDIVVVGASGTVSVYSPEDWQAPIDTYAGVGNFGRSVGLGDVDDDPGLDLIVGAETSKVGKLREAGQVYVLSGNDDGTFLALDPAAVLDGSAKEERFGSYVGSGITDLGADPEYVIAAAEFGPDPRAVVYDSPPGDGTVLITLRPDVDAAGSWAQDGFVTGDLDGNGQAEVLIGAPSAPQCDGFSNAGGRVYLYPNYVSSPLTFTSPNADVIDWDTNQFGWGKAIIDAIHHVNQPALPGFVILGQPGDQGTEGIFRWGTVHIYEVNQP